MSRFSPSRFAVLAAFLCLFAAGAALALWVRSNAVASPAVLGEVPEFTLTNERGDGTTRSSLAGKVWVADFIFTRCGGQCPLMTARMLKLQNWTAENGLGAVHFVSFTVDPDTDTTSVLAGYAQLHKADSARWQFLTAEKQVLYPLIRNGFKIGVVENPPPGQASDEEPIIHSNRFVLVDARGQIRGYYNADDDDALERLKRDLRIVSQETRGRAPG